MKKKVPKKDKLCYNNAQEVMGMIELSKVKGIGPKTEMLLNKIGISSLDDLVTHYPFRYDVLKRSNLREVTEEDKIVIDGKVESIPLVVRFRGGLNKLNFRLATPQGPVGVSIFNRAFLKPNLGIGTNIIVLGKFDQKKNIVNASDIKFGTLSNQEKIEPVYHTTSGLTQKSLSSYINNVLLQYGNEIEDKIPRYLLDKYNFLNKKTALNIVHNPPNFDKLKEASMRLKYEELFEFMFKINYLRIEKEKSELGITRNGNREELEKVINDLPYSLTNDQIKVLNEIIDDLNSQRRMNRIIQGFNINIELLTGSITKKDKKPIYDGLKDGSINIIIGTHALIQDEVEYNNLGLVVTDEQHRFGVNQRTNLKNKGIRPDVLYMSATPIPRTYALTIYGDMDVSIIKEMPKGRKPVKTIVRKESEIKDVLERMHQELQKGHQIYVIAPLIEDSENIDLTTVCNLRDKMNLAFGSRYKIDIVHGKMAPAAKDLIMNEFKQNKVNILISTTVIEVGVDVPNATMMVIFDANRFGLSTLHQLRGRVGRSELESSCILISNSDEKRLEIMESTHDGFVISEEDFKMRGSGDIFGTKQSGDMSFKIANLKSDYKILSQAKKDSLEYLKNSDYDKDPLKIHLIESVKTD